MLQEVLAALTIPGLPDWTALILLLLLLLVALAYLLMPFSVFGLKSRLDAIEAQLDEIQTELRSLTLRQPETGHRRPPVEGDWIDPAPMPRDEPPRGRGAPPPGRSSQARAEPRVDWPRQPR